MSLHRFGTLYNVPSVDVSDYLKKGALPPSTGGTLTSITAGTGLSGGTITSTGTIALNAALDLLNDVTISSPSTNQFLRYNGTQWVNETVTVGIGTVTSIVAGTGLSGGTITTAGTISLNAALDLLTDVTIATPTTNQFLRYNGTQWVNETVAIGAGTVTSVTAGTGLAGGTITNTGTISLNANLTDLNDVTLAGTPVDEHVLQYVSGQWINAPLYLGMMADVNIPSPVNGDVLRFNGISWVSAAISGVGTVTSITAGNGLSGGTITNTGTIALNANLNQLTDVTISSPFNRETLVYDSTASQWINTELKLEDLADVSIIPEVSPILRPNDSEFLRYIEGLNEWQNVPMIAGSGVSINHHSDGIFGSYTRIGLTPGTTGSGLKEMLVWNGSQWNIDTKFEIANGDTTNLLAVWNNAQQKWVPGPKDVASPISVIGPLNATQFEIPYGWTSKIVSDDQFISRGNFNPTLNDDWFYIWNAGLAQNAWAREIGWTSMAAVDKAKFRAMQNAVASSPAAIDGVNLINNYDTLMIPITECVLYTTGASAPYNESLGYAQVNVASGHPLQGQLGVRFTLRNIRNIVQGGNGLTPVVRARLAFGDIFNSTVSETPSANEIVFYDGTNWINKQLALTDLSDTQISTPTLDQILIYNGTKWQNQPFPVPDIALEEISDVTLLNINVADVLVFDGVEWTNQKVELQHINPANTPGYGSVLVFNNGYVAADPKTDKRFVMFDKTLNAFRIGQPTLQILQDVAIDTPLDLQVLQYDNSSGVWRNATVAMGGGTVTSVTAGTGLSGGTITTTGTISLNANLNNLNDVTITTPSTNQFLRYNGSQWINQSFSPVTSITAGTGLSGGTITTTGTIALNANLDLLTDVVITTPTTNQFLRYNGTNWVNQTVTLNSGTVTSITAGTGLSGGTITTTGTIALNANLDLLTDVVISTPSTNQFLRYDGTSWVNQSFTPVTSITAGTGLSGGTITTTGTIALDANLDLLTDVVITTPTTDQFLRYDGTSWVNQSFTPVTSITAGTGLSGGTITSTGTISLNANLDDLNDVVISTPSTNQFLRYDGTSWVNQTVTLNSGTVTQINTGTGLLGGPITSTGTIYLSANLNSLTDCVITTPTNNQIVRYNGATNRWNNVALTLASGIVSDVVVTTPSTNQFLRYNGTQWVNQSFTPVTSITAGTGLSGGTITTTGTIALDAGLNDLNDVTIGAGPFQGQVLTYGSGGQWINDQIGLGGLTFFDVAVAGPTNGSILSYTTFSNKWINTIPSGLVNRDVNIWNGTGWVNGRVRMSDLGGDANVNPNPASGQFLRYNGTQWVNETFTPVTSITAGTGLSGGTITSTGTISLNANLDDLNDVVITTPTNNQILRYNGTNWVNSATSTVNQVKYQKYIPHLSYPAPPWNMTTAGVQDTTISRFENGMTPLAISYAGNNIALYDTWNGTNPFIISGSAFDSILDLGVGGPAAVGASISFSGYALWQNNYANATQTITSFIYIRFTDNISELNDITGVNYNAIPPSTPNNTTPGYDPRYVFRGSPEHSTTAGERKTCTIDVHVGLMNRRYMQIGFFSGTQPGNNTTTTSRRTTLGWPSTNTAPYANYAFYYGDQGGYTWGEGTTGATPPQAFNFELRWQI